MKTTSRISLAASFVAALVFAVFAIPAIAGETAVAPQQQQQQQQRQVTPQQAFELISREAAGGNPNAMLTLGTMYERGIGVARNYDNALLWYEKAAAAGLAEGYYNAGICYEIGMGTKSDAKKAFQNFESSAALKLPQGLYKLAHLYINGTGVDKNQPWGVDLLTRAADAKHAGAANDLGVITFEGAYGQQKDLNKSFNYFTQAANLGNADAMKSLAVFYRDGLGRPADPAQELKWYALARFAGFPQAALNPAIEKVKGLMTDDQVKQVEQDAQTWVRDFQQRTQAEAQAAQAQAQQAQAAGAGQ